MPGRKVTPNRDSKEMAPSKPCLGPPVSSHLKELTTVLPRAVYFQRPQKLRWKESFNRLRKLVESGGPRLAG